MRYLAKTKGIQRKTRNEIRVSPQMLAKTKGIQRKTRNEIRVSPQMLLQKTKESNEKHAMKSGCLPRCSQMFPRPKFGHASWQAVIDFAAACKESVAEVVMSVVGEPVSTPDEVEKCRAIARSVGAELRVRAYEKPSTGRS